jgi:YegS/Rv2252/BmrU family lipid kinase
MGWLTAENATTAMLLVLLVLTVTTFVLLRRERLRRERRPGPVVAAGSTTEPPRLAVVANPTKLLDVDERARWVREACGAAGWAEPLWLETTLEDPGGGQAALAVHEGASTVLAYGGDGTVRSVVAALEGSSVPLALMPAGTGNLLARNLGIPVSDLDAALAVALSDTTRRIDVAQAEIDVSGEDQDAICRPFLVMAGLGFDAEVMAATEPRLKERVGWMAYVVQGTRMLRGHDTRVTLRLDDDPPLRRRVRSVIVGNCGELTGGVRLLPDAEVDDGWLDLAVVSPNGVVGWAALTLTVLTRHRRGHPVVEHMRCRRVEVLPEHPLQVQLDGDPVGTARAMRVHVDPSALVIKVPRAAATRPSTSPERVSRSRRWSRRARHRENGGI